MVQCENERCKKWQHTECMGLSNMEKVEGDAPYTCHKCTPRELDLEIPYAHDELAASGIDVEKAQETFDAAEKVKHVLDPIELQLSKSIPAIKDMQTKLNSERRAQAEELKVSTRRAEKANSQSIKLQDIYRKHQHDAVVAEKRLAREVHDAGVRERKRLLYERRAAAAAAAAAEAEAAAAAAAAIALEEAVRAAKGKASRKGFKWANQPAGTALHRAKFPFNTVEVNELTFGKGDELWVVETPNGWWQAQHVGHGGKSGLVPSNYIDPVPVAEQMQQIQAERIAIAAADAVVAAETEKAAAASAAAAAAAAAENASGKVDHVLAGLAGIPYWDARGAPAAAAAVEVDHGLAGLAGIPYWDAQGAAGMATAAAKKDDALLGRLAGIAFWDARGAQSAKARAGADGGSSSSSSSSGEVNANANADAVQEGGGAAGGVDGSIVVVEEKAPEREVPKECNEVIAARHVAQVVKKKVTDSLKKLTMLHQRELVPSSRFVRQAAEQLHAIKAAEKNAASLLKSFESENRETLKKMIACEEDLVNARADLDQVQCIFYRTVVIKGEQYRVGDCVYVNQKGAKRRSAKERRREIIYRIEKLWRDATGQVMAMGHYFHRPGDVHIKPNQKFFPQEIIVSTFTETFSMDTVLGLCWVMRVKDYFLGRPSDVADEEDVWVVDYRYVVESKGWNKLPSKDPWPTPTHKSVFNMFSETEPLQSSRWPLNAAGVPDVAAVTEMPKFATKAQQQAAKKKERKKKEKAAAEKEAAKRKVEEAELGEDPDDADSRPPTEAEIKRSKAQRKGRPFASLLEELLETVQPMKVASSRGRMAAASFNKGAADYSHLLAVRKPTKPRKNQSKRSKT